MPIYLSVHVYVCVTIGIRVDLGERPEGKADAVL